MSDTLLDSNVIIDLLNGLEAANQAVAEAGDAAMSVITWIEVMAGTRDTEEESRARAFLSTFHVLPLSTDVAERAVQIRRERRMKLPDAIIWATAVTHGLVLVTRNTKDFPTDDASIRIPYQM